VSGYVRTETETGHTMLGRIVTDRPRWVVDASAGWRTKDFGRIALSVWTASELSPRYDDERRRYFNEIDPKLGYGYEYALADVCRDERDEILDIAMDKDGHVFKLQDFDCVFEMYKADPMNFDRVWKGRNDLTASVKIDFDGPDLRIVANVRDEQLADGDCLFVIVDGVGKRFAPDCLIEKGARYVGKIACPKPESVMEIRVEDDDGCGKEGWVTTGQFRVTRN
jgi:hypothetical protein